MIRGYARVSTARQEQGTSLADQRSVLEAEGCEAVYQDVYTGKAMNRPGFDRLRAEVRPGDTIVVTKLDRIARTETEAYELVVGWVRDGIKVRVLNMGTIEDTEIGRLILHIMLMTAATSVEKDRMESKKASEPEAIRDSA